MANAWFRMYAEFATDPKVQMLSESDQRRFVMLLCMRCSNGDVTLQDEEVAFQLRISGDEWAATKALLIQRGLLTSTGAISNWDKRQFVSDSSKSRVSKFRAKAKQACNVTGTAAKRPSNALDTDTDTDTEKKKSTAPTTVGVSDLIADGLPPDLAAEWIAHRKRQRAALTPRAWAGIKREAATARMTPAAAVQKAIERGWRGFEAEWVTDSPRAAAPQPEPIRKTLNELGLT